MGQTPVYDQLRGEPIDADVPPSANAAASIDKVMCRYQASWRRSGSSSRPVSFLGELEGFLHSPAGSGDANQLGEGDRRAAAADVSRRNRPVRMTKSRPPGKQASKGQPAVTHTRDKMALRTYIQTIIASPRAARTPANLGEGCWEPVVRVEIEGQFVAAAAAPTDRWSHDQPRCHARPAAPQRLDRTEVPAHRHHDLAGTGNRRSRTWDWHWGGMATHQPSCPS